MYKIAVMGERDSIFGFAALGLDTYAVTSDEETLKTFKQICGGQYAIIYITEALQAKLGDELDKYRTEPLPAIIPIPGISGNTGMGMLNVKRSVEQAVGSDIIFNNEQ